MATIESFIWYLYSKDINKFEEAHRIITTAIQNPCTTRFSIRPHASARQVYISSIYNIPCTEPTNNDPNDSILNLLAMFAKDYDISITQTLGEIAMPYGKYMGTKIKNLTYKYMLFISSTFKDTSHYAIDTKAEIIARMCTMQNPQVKSLFLKYTKDQIDFVFNEVQNFFA